MTEGPGRSLDEVLERLRSVDGVEAVAVARLDGLVVSHRLPSWMDPNLMAAMAAVLVGAASQVGQALGRGALRACQLRCEEGRVIAFRTPGSTILVVLLSEEADVNGILTSLEDATEEIGQALSALLPAAPSQAPAVQRPA